MPTLLLAAVLDSPALWHAFVAHDLDYTTAGVRYLIAVVVAAVMMALVRSMASGYTNRNDRARAAAKLSGPARRADDTDDSDSDSGGGGGSQPGS
ncbi:MAG: hypothetical protein QOE03_2649 [Micromonosporaceae bacterium]|jgi:hypothetical protein|nr:hypothetical protein [Micromonosporaceae bacterium]